MLNNFIPHACLLFHDQSEGNHKKKPQTTKVIVITAYRFFLLYQIGFPSIHLLFIVFLHVQFHSNNLRFPQQLTSRTAGMISNSHSFIKLSLLNCGSILEISAMVFAVSDCENTSPAKVAVTLFGL